jgi:hypothetical protein
MLSSSLKSKRITSIKRTVGIAKKGGAVLRLLKPLPPELEPVNDFVQLHSAWRTLHPESIIRITKTRFVIHTPGPNRRIEPHFLIELIALLIAIAQFINSSRDEYHRLQLLLNTCDHKITSFYHNTCKSCEKKEKPLEVAFPPRSGAYALLEVFRRTSLGYLVYQTITYTKSAMTQTVNFIPVEHAHS